MWSSYFWLLCELVEFFRAYFWQSTLNSCWLSRLQPDCSRVSRHHQLYGSLCNYQSYTWIHHLRSDSFVYILSRRYCRIAKSSNLWADEDFSDCTCRLLDDEVAQTSALIDLIFFSIWIVFETPISKGIWVSLSKEYQNLSLTPRFGYKKNVQPTKPSNWKIQHFFFCLKLLNIFSSILLLT